MKRVLFLIESLSGGGAEKVLVTLLNNIDRNKFDICLCTIVDTGINRDFLNKDIKRVSIISEPKSNFFSKLNYWVKYQLVYRLLPLNWVYKLWIPQNYDVEVAFVEGFTTKLLASSTNRNAKKIAWVHTDLVNNHWIDSIYSTIDEEKISYESYDKVVAVSESANVSLQKLYNLSNVLTLYNPIDSNKIQQQNSLLPSNAPRNGLKLITTGRLVPQKGYDRLLGVLNKLMELNLDFHLTILGEGDERNNLQSLIEQYDLNNSVSMPGFIENPYALMHDADLFVCSSRSEGYSTAVTEALILGLPVITTECSGMRELLGDCEYGLITDNDEESLFNGLCELLTQPELLHHYRSKAKERGQDFKIDKLMRPIESLLAE